MSPKTEAPAAPAVPYAYDPANPPTAQAQPGQRNPFDQPPQQISPLWPLGIDLSLHVYLSTSPTGDVFSGQWTKNWRENEDDELPHFVWENITYGNWNEKRITNLDVSLPLVSAVYALLTAK